MVKQKEDSNIDVVPFSFEGAKIRTMMQDDMPWFNANDVCKALGYVNSRKSISDHVDEEDRNTVTIRYGIRGNPNQTFVNESGLYALIFGSKKPEAKRFKRWVTSEVLPTIRKTGRYQHAAAFYGGDYLKYQMVGQYELSPAFFARLFYALDKQASAAALIFHLMRLGALNQWVAASFRDLSRGMDHAISSSSVHHHARSLQKRGVLDVVINTKSNQYMILGGALDTLMAKIPELDDMRPGLEFIPSAIALGSLH